jgi:hypothetical protein
MGPNETSKPLYLCVIKDDGSIEPLKIKTIESNQYDLRNELLRLLGGYLKALMKLPSIKDCDGFEKLMRFYFELLDKMNP